MTKPLRTSSVYALHLGDFNYRYVGMTKFEPEQRMNQHRYNANSGISYPVYRWMRKHPSSVRMEILVDGLTEQEAKFYESVAIAGLREAGSRLLNCTDGGDGVTGWKMTPAQREAHAASRRGIPMADETKKKLSTSVRETWSDETLRAEQAARSAASWTPERRAEQAARGRAAIAANRKPMTPEGRAAQRQKVSAKWTPERRAAQAEATRQRITGLKWTPEQRAAKSAQTKAQWAAKKMTQTPQQDVAL